MGLEKFICRWEIIRNTEKSGAQAISKRCWLSTSKLRWRISSSAIITK